MNIELDDSIIDCINNAVKEIKKREKDYISEIKVLRKYFSSLESYSYYVGNTEIRVLGGRLTKSVEIYRVPQWFITTGEPYASYDGKLESWVEITNWSKEDIHKLYDKRENILMEIGKKYGCI